MAASWSELPSELLGVVFLDLRCLADRVYFAAVCRSWRSAARARASAGTPPPQLPWLLLLPSAGAPCFVSPLAGSARRRLSLPYGAHGARLCGSHPSGWLAVAANGWRAYALVNVFSRAWAPLPDRMRVPRHGITTCLVVRAVALSAPPTSRACVAAALVCGVSNLAFVRPTMDRHWVASEPVHGLQDILYHDGEVVRGFHAVTSDEAVTVFVQEGAPGALALTMARRSYRMQRRPNAPAPSPSSVSRYLVESRGKLLMVVRHFPSTQHGGGAAAARGFEFLELEVQDLPSGGHAASWVELDGGLDGRVIFLARGCSRALEASQFGGFQEGIYFLDDTGFDISLALSCGGNFPCSDVGWYSGREIMRGIEGFPSEFQSTFSAPTWFYP
ncbi:hypothetical protein SEVIR_5G261301v4 [Setaria viridis]|uniref:KIB1-4 beta-propeller domain-containing protein n=2 Tax=Setaria TaxID=4554 RepID=K3XIT5_SETIT|nr:uncharacterized protein LOC101772865 [Setaria italica]XP_034594692.1 uncharacterized protein LOC117856430 [Setaria viridis]TKW15791.1 hypothetical protein SEVIR_5G261301v2 [Setaria viridis]